MGALAGFGGPRVLVPMPGTKGSLLARDPGGHVEARVRESVILAGCLNHPDVALACEDRLERLAFRCPDLGAVRDALVAALATVGPGDGEALRAAIAARLGNDPMPLIAACGPVRANPHVRADSDPERAARAVDEELTRHAAQTGRDEEIREAAIDLAATDDEAITLRVRAAAEAEQSANSRPLEDDHSDDETERLEFARVIAAAEASPPRRPRKH